jgi:serine/threonine protein kinase/CheY-like chemotaxis protein
MGHVAAKLLIVDDSRSTRAALQAFLEEHGYEVVALSSGEEALAALDNERFDLVLLDVVMKGLDGLTVLERIRERHDEVELPVLMATARADSSDVVRALELGASDYVTKPIDLVVALARIESHLALREAIAQKRAKPAPLAPGGVLPLGTVLDDRYELRELLGSGGFAVVYGARQVSTGQRVAVKVMKAHRAAGGDIELARFRREMSVIGELRHPHIVRLVDSGWLEVEPEPLSSYESAPEDSVTRTSNTVALRPGGARRASEPAMEAAPAIPDAIHLAGVSARIPYIVMEYLEGRPLSSLLEERGRIRVDEIVDIVLPVVSALWQAHSSGVVHRDVKPSNIFLADVQPKDVRPTVVDFGVAKLVREADEGLTDDGMVGTPGWWSPEQARGVELDERSDQYQLGAVLYRAVTGAKPFDGRGMRVVHEIANGRFKPPSQVVDDLPNGFEAVLMTLMAREPDDRYPTMRAAARGLLPFASKRGHRLWEPVFEPGDTYPPPGNPDET